MAGYASDGRNATVSSNPAPVMATILRGALRLERDAAPPELPPAGILAAATALKRALKIAFSFAATRFERLVW
jgi:hypothetical protein